MLWGCSVLNRLAAGLHLHSTAMLVFACTTLLQAYTLHMLRQRSDVEVVGLLTTLNGQADRVAMHAVRSQLLRMQAAAAGLPVHEVGGRNTGLHGRSVAVQLCVLHEERGGGARERGGEVGEIEGERDTHRQKERGREGESWREGERHRERGTGRGEEGERGSRGRGRERGRGRQKEQL